MLILHVGRSQMHAITNIYPPSPTTVFKAVKDTSLPCMYSVIPLCLETLICIII